jgi:murein hydrolase activator
MGRIFTRYILRTIFPGNLTRGVASLCGLLMVLIAVGGVPLISSTSHASTTDKEKMKLEEGINKYRINIRRLQQGIRLQQEELEHNLSREKDLLAQLEDLDMRLAEQREKLDVLKGRMTAQQDLITVKEKELDRVKQDKNAVQLHLQKRLNAYYKMGRIGLINVAFSAQTLPELLSFHDSFQSLIRYDQNLIETYRQSISQLERVKEALTLEKSLLQEFITQEEEEKNQIDATIQEKQNLLTLIRTKTKLHQQAIKEMEEASTDLTSSLVVMQKKEQILDQRFLLNRGKLTPPVDGTIVTLFHQETTNRLGITSKSNGIAFKAPDGTQVRAIFDGTVLYSGYVRGYGNTVVVDHGYQYYSIVSRVEKLLKRAGDKVGTGDIIAVMGDTATLIDEGLYLEIRHGQESLDPLKWLAKDKISIDSNEKKPPSED